VNLSVRELNKKTGIWEKISIIMISALFVTARLSMS